MGQLITGQVRNCFFIFYFWRVCKVLCVARCLASGRGGGIEELKMQLENLKDPKEGKIRE